MTNWIDVQNKRILLGTIALLISFVFSHTSHAAPQELLGKTISVRTTSTSVWLNVQGRTFSTHQTSEGAIYVSTLGRVFMRAGGVRAAPAGSLRRSSEQSPNEHLKGGDYHFVGNTLVRAGNTGGVQFVNTITFDPLFKTCHLSQQYKVVSYARDIAAGTPVKLVRHNIDSETCSITEGNVFAN